MRKFIKKSAAIIATAAFATTFGITASAAGAVTEVTTSSVITENTDTTTPPVVTTTAEVFVPITEANISDEIDLSKVTINGAEVSISDISLSDMLSATKIKHCIYGSTSIDVDNYNFFSGMFGLQTDETDITSFEGTMVSIEVVDEKNNVVSQPDLDEKDFGAYKVVGVHTSDFFTHDDFSVSYYGGITTGMAKADLVDILGDGIIINDEIIYKNTNNTMIVALCHMFDVISGGIFKLIRHIFIIDFACACLCKRVH